MISTFHNDSPIIVVHHELVLSTDDTVQYIFEGKGESKEQFSFFAYNFSAAGTVAPIFITVIGLSEREMLEDQCIDLHIEGICVGGGGV